MQIFLINTFLFSRIKESGGVLASYFAVVLDDLVYNLRCVLYFINALLYLISSSINQLKKVDYVHY